LTPKVISSRKLEFITKKVFNSLFFRVLGMVSGVVFTWLVARYFGATGLGIMSINISVLYLAIIFLKLGLDSHAVSEVSKMNSDGRSNEIGGYYRMLVIINMITALIGTIIIYFSSSFIASLLDLEESSNFLKSTSFFLAPLMLLHLNAGVMRGFKRIMTHSFFLNGGVSFIGLFILLPLLNGGSDVALPLFSQYFSICFLALISTIMVFKRINSLSNARNQKTYLAIIKESWPMMVSDSSSPLWSWGGVFLVGLFAPLSAVGAYQVLSRITNFIGLPLRSINSIMAPVFSEHRAKSNNEGISKAIIQNSQLSFLLSLPALLFIIIFAKNILGFFSGDFVEYWLLLWFLAGVTFINACHGSMTIILLMTGHQSLQGKLSFITLVFFLVLMFGLSVLFGISGAVLALGLAIIIRNLLVARHVKRLFGTYPFAFAHKFSFKKLSHRS
jgi:O-antigen/teichoic acid export membrane protein